MAKFVMMVDNEVVETYDISDEVQDKFPDFARRVAILRSNPVYMEVDEVVPEGSVWNGSSFVLPQ